jgi:hypothetical protein
MARDWFINEYDKYNYDSATLFMAESFYLEAESVTLW